MEKENVKDKTNNEEITKKQSDVDKAATAVNAQSEEELHLSFYTVTAMLAVLAAAVTTMLSGIMLAKPAFYVTKSQFGGLYYDDMVDFFNEIIFTSDKASKLNIYCIIVAALSAVATVLILIVVAKASNPSKKPAILISAVAFLFGVAALVVQIMERSYGLGVVKDYLDSIGDIADTMLSMSDYVFIAVIANTVFLLLAVIGTTIGRKKWNESGKSY